MQSPPPESKLGLPAWGCTDGRNIRICASIDRKASSKVAPNKRKEPQSLPISIVNGRRPITRKRHDLARWGGGEIGEAHLRRLNRPLVPPTVGKQPRHSAARAYFARTQNQSAGRRTGTEMSEEPGEKQKEPTGGSDEATAQPQQEGQACPFGFSGLYARLARRTSRTLLFLGQADSLPRRCLRGGRS